MPSLGKDLASIRKEQNLTLQDIHEATKIPASILKSIEDDTIFSGIDENTTYIRSYVRSYAKAVHVDEDLIIETLDQVETGSYQGLLRKEDSPQKTTFHYDSGEGEGKGEEDQESPETADSDMVHDHSPQFSSREDPSEKEKPKQQVSGRSAATPPASVRSVDWADMGHKFTPLEKKSRMWVVVAILAVALVGVSLFLWYQYSLSSNEVTPQNTNRETTQGAVTSDSLQLDLAAPATDGSQQETMTTDRVTPAEELPDTLTLVIYAAYEKLEPVRVYTDVMDSLNPYWIEHGEAYRFDFVNTLRLRGQYSRMVLLLNGHPLENFLDQFLDQESGMVEINRSYFEGDPKWLQPPPDLLQINAPPPTVIKERPIFN